MKKLSNIIVLLLVAMIVSGCADKRIILVPQAEYYPTFPTEDFNMSEKYTLNMWVETEEINNSEVTYLVAENTEMKGFILDTKTLRSNYNLLLKKLNMFNLRIQELNKIQKDKKPVEIESISDSWFN